MNQKFKGVIAPLRLRRFCGRLNADFSSHVLDKYGVFRPLWQGAMLIHRRGYNGAKNESVFIQRTIRQIQNQALADLHLRFMLTLHFHHPVSIGAANRERGLVHEPYFFQQRPLQFFNTRASGETGRPQAQPPWFHRLLHLQPFNARDDYRTADSPGPLRQINSRNLIQKKFFDFFATASRGDQSNDRFTRPVSRVFFSRVNGNVEARESRHLAHQSFLSENDRVSANARPAFLTTTNLHLASYALRPEGATPSLPYAQSYASYPMTLVYSLAKLQTEKATTILNHFLQAVTDRGGEPAAGYDRAPLTNAARSAPNFASPYSFPPEMKLVKPPPVHAPPAKNNAPSPSPPTITPLPRQTVTLQDLDIQKLTNRVYDEFERKLRMEKERRGL